MSGYSPYTASIPMLSPALLDASAGAGASSSRRWPRLGGGGGACLFSFTSTLMVVAALLGTLGFLLALVKGGGAGAVASGTMMNFLVWGVGANLAVSGIYALTCSLAPGASTWVLAGLLAIAALLMYLLSGSGAAFAADTYPSRSAAVATEGYMFDPSDPNHLPERMAPERTHAGDDESDGSLRLTGTGVGAVKSAAQAKRKKDKKRVLAVRPLPNNKHPLRPA